MTKLYTNHPWRLGTLACGVALLAGCASAPPKAERYIAPPPGATWQVQVTNRGSFGNADKVVQGASVRNVVVEGKPYHRFDTSSGATLQTDTAGVFMVLGAGDRPLMRYEPPLGFDFPLEVGKTWTQDLTLTVGGSVKTPMKAQWKVEAYETVTVPAGTFKAWRVVMTDNFGFKQTTWSMADTVGVYARRINERPATHPQGGAGTQVIELLSLPAVK
jgi:starvation-inducible outer membrane lipoprotein